MPKPIFRGKLCRLRGGPIPDRNWLYIWDLAILLEAEFAELAGASEGITNHDFCFKVLSSRAKRTEVEGSRRVSGAASDPEAPRDPSTPFCCASLRSG